MDVGKAFTFVADEPGGRWKTVIGGLVVLAGVLAGVTVLGGLAALALVGGYLVRVLRNVIAGEWPVLPEWADWGGLQRGVVAREVGGWGIIACGIGLPLTIVYAPPVAHHLYGRAHRLAHGAPADTRRAPHPASGSVSA